MTNKNKKTNKNNNGKIVGACMAAVLGIGAIAGAGYLAYDYMVPHTTITAESYISIDFKYNGQQVKHTYVKAGELLTSDVFTGLKGEVYDDLIVGYSVDGINLIDINTFRPTANTTINICGPGQYKDGQYIKTWQQLIDENYIKIDSNKIIGGDKIEELDGELVCSIKIGWMDQNSMIKKSKITKLTTNQQLNGSSDLNENTTLIEVVANEGFNITSGYAFYKCTALKKVTLNNCKIESLRDSTFFGCKNLTDFVVNNNTTIEEVGSMAFQDCTNLKELYLPGLTRITSNFIRGSGVKTFWVPKTCTVANSGSNFSIDDIYCECSSAEDNSSWAEDWYGSSTIHYGYTYEQYLEAIKG